MKCNLTSTDEMAKVSGMKVTYCSPHVHSLSTTEEALKSLRGFPDPPHKMTCLLMLFGGVSVPEAEIQ